MITVLEGAVSNRSHSFRNGYGFYGTALLKGIVSNSLHSMGDGDTTGNIAAFYQYPIFDLHRFLHPSMLSLSFKIQFIDLLINVILPFVEHQILVVFKIFFAAISGNEV